MHPALQIALGILATVAAIASAIAAWKAQVAANESLSFQKNLSKHQETLLLLRVTLDGLWQLKRILLTPLNVSDEEFGKMEALHSQIKTNLEMLERNGMSVFDNNSSLFKAASFGEIVDQLPTAECEINLIIKRLQARVDDIFS